MLDHNHEPLKKRLERKGLRVVAELSCKGLDTSGVFNYIDGINNNRPNEDDLHGARELARTLIESLQAKTTESPDWLKGLTDEAMVRRTLRKLCEVV